MRDLLLTMSAAALYLVMTKLSAIVFSPSSLSAMGHVLGFEDKEEERGRSSQLAVGSSAGAGSSGLRLLGEWVQVRSSVLSARCLREILPQLAGHSGGGAGRWPKQAEVTDRKGRHLTVT